VRLSGQKDARLLIGMSVRCVLASPPEGASPEMCTTRRARDFQEVDCSLAPMHLGTGERGQTWADGLRRDQTGVPCRWSEGFHRLAFDVPGIVGFWLYC
jgi:hypothetical protein